jgi:hypothetical protein
VSEENTDPLRELIEAAVSCIEDRNTGWIDHGNSVRLEAAVSHARLILGHRESYLKEVEQLRVQLAGCLVAAEGNAVGDNDAPQGTYGWSLAYERTKEVKTALDVARETNKRFHRRVQAMESLAQRWFPKTYRKSCFWCKLKERLKW